MHPTVNVFASVKQYLSYNICLYSKPSLASWACGNALGTFLQAAMYEAESLRKKKMKLTNAVAKALQESVTSDTLSRRLYSIEQYGFLPNAIAKLETARLHIQVQFYTLDSIWGKLGSAAIKKSFSSRSRKTLTLSLLGHVSGLAAACFGHNTASTHTVHSMHRTRCSAECITVHKSSTLRMAIKCIIYIY